MHFLVVRSETLVNMFSVGAKTGVMYEPEIGCLQLDSIVP